uniref:Uncharacterized protein n=1 Tax=Arundo donax TaxID=35708 RepID=A0A0A9FM74_ARUDO
MQKLENYTPPHHTKLKDPCYDSLLQRPIASPTLILSPALTQKLKSEELMPFPLAFDTGASNMTTTVDPMLNPAISSPFSTITPEPSGS